MEEDREVKEVVDLDFERVIYLGQDLCLASASAQDLELTAGRIATMMRVPVGFLVMVQNPHQ